MDMDYKHTQYGALILLMFLIIGLLLTPLLSSMFAEDKTISALVTIGLFLLFLVTFFAQTIEISDGKLTFWFGIGLIRKSYSLEAIQSAEAVKSPWYYLWGIKSIPGGWYYAVAPGSAVEIIFKDQKVVRLGTNQPQELKKVLDLCMAAESRP